MQQRKGGFLLEMRNRKKHGTMLSCCERERRRRDRDLHQKLLKKSNHHGKQGGRDREIRREGNSGERRRGELKRKCAESN